MKFIFNILISAACLCAAQATNDCNDKNYHSLETENSARLNCGDAFEQRCLCQRICYDRQYQYVVDCTNAGFSDASVLSQLPNKTQVLIFKGNIIKQLPWNVFGNMDNLPNLRVIDMSNNHIREIPGKAYHHVKNVERLVLDFNELSLDPGKNHPRVFSNFISLLELHLSNAFEHGPPRSLAETLHDIFVNSNLTQLIKLHLEQNEISEFRERKVFCDLPSLLHLYLADNTLTELRFDITCLKKLSVLDLQRNKFTRVLERDLRVLDSFPKRNQTLRVDFSNNPFECSCKLNSFVRWLAKTKVVVEKKELLRCRKSDNSWSPIYETEGCIPFEKSRIMNLFSTPKTDTSTVLLCLLSVLLVLLVCALIYVQRKELHKKLAPVLDSVNKRVHYTSISTRDTREVDG